MKKVALKRMKGNTKPITKVRTCCLVISPLSEINKTISMIKITDKMIAAASGGKELLSIALKHKKLIQIIKKSPVALIAVSAISFFVIAFCTFHFLRNEDAVNIIRADKMVIAVPIIMVFIIYIVVKILFVTNLIKSISKKQ